MRHFLRSFTKWDYLFFVLAGIAYYMLIRQWFPWPMDDYCYAFNCRPPHTLINSFSDILQSQCYHYLHTNGRFLAHCFVQLFSAYNSVWFFICSTFVFTLFLMCGTYLIRRGQPNILICDKLLFIALVILLFPQLAICFFVSDAFVVNYLWGTTLSLAFLVLYIHIKDDHIQYALWQHIILFITATTIGSWHEGFSIPIAGMLCVYHLIHIRELSKSMWVLLLGYALGAAICVFAPANFIRSANEGLAIIANFSGILVTLIKLRYVWATLFVVLIFGILYDRKRQQHFVSENYYYFLPPIFSLLFALVICLTGTQQFTIIAVCTVISLLRLLYQWQVGIPLRLSYGIYGLLLVGISVCYVSFYTYRQDMHNAFVSMEEDIKTNPKTVHSATEFQRVIHQGSDTTFIRKHILHVNTDFFFDHIYYSSTFFGRYFTKSSNDTTGIFLLPETQDTIVARCTYENQLSKDVYYVPKTGYYIIKQPIDVDNCTLYFGCEATNYVERIKDQLKKRPFKTSERSLTSKGSCNFTCEGFRYYIVNFMPNDNREVANVYVVADAESARK